MRLTLPSYFPAVATLTFISFCFHIAYPFLMPVLISAKLSGFEAGLVMSAAFLGAGFLQLIFGRMLDLGRALVPIVIAFVAEAIGIAAILAFFSYRVIATFY